MNVRAEALSVSLGGRPVLEGIDLEAHPGEVLGVVGPNGAGKTTLLRATNGTLVPDDGRVLVGGDDVATLSAREASRRVATVPQGTDLAFEFTVREVVAMGRHPHRPRLSLGGDPDPGAVTAAMERTGVARFADRSVTAVSGGERQRVLLARALAQDAPVTLLDEPTASLDVGHAVRTLGLAADLAAEGRTVVAAIHDLNLAARYCDRLALLAEGALVRVGAPTAVLAREPLERAFGARVAVARDPVTDTPLVTALAPGEGVGGDRGHVHVVGCDGAATPLIHPLASAGFEVTTGVVPEGGRAAVVAEALGCEAVTAPPFAMTDAARRAALALARDADAVVLAPVRLSAGTLPNLAVAAAADRLVVVESDRPPAARDGTDSPGVAARERYETLCERGTVTDADGLLEAVAAAVADPDVRTADGTAGRGV